MTITALQGTAYAVRLNTKEAAEKLRIKSQTMRAAYCRDGHFHGIRPLKSATRFLLWDADDIERLANGEVLI